MLYFYIYFLHAGKLLQIAQQICIHCTYFVTSNKIWSHFYTIIISTCSFITYWFVTVNVYNLKNSAFPVSKKVPSQISWVF